MKARINFPSNKHHEYLIELIDSTQILFGKISFIMPNFINIDKSIFVEGLRYNLLSYDTKEKMFTYVEDIEESKKRFNRDC